MANSFFKNGDKAYSENLNDSVLVGNAFDWTVDVSLPADTEDVFPNSSSVVKAKVVDASITPNANLSIGGSIENTSGSSQVYRLTVYPNFNRFGGFQSITLTGDGTFYIANKGANSPIVNNLDYDNLGNVPELKVLKEYDIVVTIPNNGEVTGLGFVLQSSNADVSGSISQSNVTGLNNVITEQNGRLTALETVNGNIYNYNLSSSSYNVEIDTSVIISCHCTNISGSNVSGKTLTLKKNGVSVGTANTNANGVATWTVTCNEWGLHTFEVNGKTIQVNVKGWKLVRSQADGKILIYTNGTDVQFSYQGSIGVNANGQTDIGTIPSEYAPKEIIVALNHPTTTDTNIAIGSDGGLTFYNRTSSTSATMRVLVTYALKSEIIS